MGLAFERNGPWRALHPAQTMKPPASQTGTKGRMAWTAAALSLGAFAYGNAFVALPASRFSPEPGGRAEVLTAEVALAAPAQEVVPSWNASWTGGSLRVEIQALYPDRASVPFDLGTWSLDAALRSSVNGQTGPDGRVLTDTIVLAKPATRLRVIVTRQPDAEGRTPELREFFLALTPPNWKAPAVPASAQAEGAWGRVLELPEKAQHDYPNGNVLCSPTSISMLMNGLGNRLDRPELKLDVPDVVQRIHDPAWGGTGNWPFNTALPGSFAGIRAFVARLNGITDAERFIAAGIPIAISHDYNILLDKQWDGDGGHLVVLIGFTEGGDAVVNDPAKGAQVRQIYPRERFARAWASSKHTVYVVLAEGDELPAGGGPWPAEHS